MIKYIIILVLALLICGGACFTLYKKWRLAVAEKSSVIQLQGKTAKSVEYYQNKLKQEVAKNETLQLESKTLRQLQKEGQLETLQQFNGLKRSLRNLENIITTKTTVSNSAAIPITIDSAGNSKFSYDDTFWGVDGMIRNDTIFVTDTTLVPLDIVVYWKKKWFLGRKHYKAEATSENKKARITGLESIKVRKR